MSCCAGGGGHPNYDTVSVSLAEQALSKAKLPGNIMVDCSHANSWKSPEYQPLLRDVASIQIPRRQPFRIIGVMIESFIEAGNQPILKDIGQMKYGCSVTDACISWETTEAILTRAHQELRPIIAAQESRVSEYLVAQGAEVEASALASPSQFEKPRQFDHPNQRNRLAPQRRPACRRSCGSGRGPPPSTWAGYPRTGIWPTTGFLSPTWTRR